MKTRYGFKVMCSDIYLAKFVVDNYGKPILFNSIDDANEELNHQLKEGRIPVMIVVEYYGNREASREKSLAMSSM